MALDVGWAVKARERGGRKWVRKSTQGTSVSSVRFSLLPRKKKRSEANVVQYQG